MDRPIKLYPNESVSRIIAFIPPQHHHLRLVIELPDQVIVLHEATVAAIVRAYISIATHPTRRAVEMVQQNVPKDRRKLGYAKWQLVEVNSSEDEIVARGCEILQRASIVSRTQAA